MRAQSGKATPASEHTVGYRKPPTHSRFKKGKSGNPNGRPKGTVNFATVLLKTLREKVVIKENGRRTVITKLEASVKQLVNKAASGRLTCPLPPDRHHPHSRAKCRRRKGLERSPERARQESDVEHSQALQQVHKRGTVSMARIPIEQEFAALLRSDFHGFIERSFYELNPTTEF